VVLDKGRNVIGFGHVLTRAMVNWGGAQESRFVFNLAQAIKGADRNAVREKFLAKKRTLEASVTSDPAELQRIAKEPQSSQVFLWLSTGGRSQDCNAGRGRLSMPISDCLVA
jgi:DNA-binding helix-hairpin-helix protein with protein kinase domain